MSTRSYIAMKTGENTYKAVYCHYDGYLAYNGAMLLEYYNTKERVEELISLGNISSLREKITPEKGSTHSFDKPDKDVTVFYGRDRGEKGQEAFTCTEEELKDPTSWIEYIYVTCRANRNAFLLQRRIRRVRPLCGALRKRGEENSGQHPQHPCHPIPDRICTSAAQRMRWLL